MSLKAQVREVQLPTKVLVTDLSGPQRGCRCRLDGLIGTDFFRDRIVEIDYNTKMIRFRKMMKVRTEGEIVPLRASPKAIQVSVTVEGQSGWMRLDTGCASELEWVSPRHVSRDGSRKMSIGLTEITTPTSKTQVQLGSLVFDDVPTGVHDRTIFAGETGLLGNGLLETFDRVSSTCGVGV